MEGNDSVNGTFLKHEALIVTETNAPKSKLQESTNYTQPVEALAIMDPLGCVNFILLGALTEQSTSYSRQTREALINGWKHFLTYGRSVCVIHVSILTWTLTVRGIVCYLAELQLGFCFDPGGINLLTPQPENAAIILNSTLWTRCFLTGRVNEFIDADQQWEVMLVTYKSEKHSGFKQVCRLVKPMLVTHWGIKSVLGKDGLIHLLIEHLTIYLAMPNNLMLLQAYGKETIDANKVAALNNKIYVFLALSCKKLHKFLVMSMEGDEAGGCRKTIRLAWYPVLK